MNSNGGESEAIHFIWQNLSWCYLLRVSSFSSCPYLVLLESATPSVIPATLCNTGEFKNSLAIKMFWVWFFCVCVCEPVNPVYRTWLLKQLCWCNGGGGRQAVLWGQAGTGEQQDSSEPASEEFTWEATALVHRHFLPLLPLPLHLGALWLSIWRPLAIPSGDTCLNICFFLYSVQAGLGVWFIFKSSQGHLPTEHQRRAIYRNHQTNFHTD